MTFVSEDPRRLSLIGSAASSDRTLSRCRSTSAMQRDIHQRDLDCRSFRWAVTLKLVSEAPIRPVLIHRNRRRRFAATTRKSRGWHQTAAMNGTRELIVKARRRQSLKSKKSLERSGQMSLRCLRLNSSIGTLRRFLGEREIKSEIDFWAKYLVALSVDQLTDCSFPERFRAFFYHDFLKSIDDTGVGRLSVACDNLQASFNDIGWCDERSGGDAGDGSSGEKREWVIVTERGGSWREKFSHKNDSYPSSSANAAFVCA